MKTFEQLHVWQAGTCLSVDIYRVLRSCRDRGLVDQMTRAAVSIPSNIAEGYERESNREFARFLKIAKGSCGELRTQLTIASRIGVINASEASALHARCVELSRMLSGLVRQTMSKC